MIVSFALSQLAALPDALLALWLALLGEGVVGSRDGLVLAPRSGWPCRRRPPGS